MFNHLIGETLLVDQLYWSNSSEQVVNAQCRFEPEGFVDLFGWVPRAHFAGERCVQCHRGPELQ